MKRLTLVFGLLALAPFAHAGGKSYGTAGCGLGTMIMGKKDNQILAATSNGTSGNQTFGITSGTSNCVDSGAVKTAKLVTVFIELNRQALASDIAKGRGEHLSSLAQLLRCQDKSGFGHEMQKNYRSIFPNEETSAQEVEFSIRSLINNEKNLSQNCVS